MSYKSLLILEKILMALPKSVRKNFFVFLAFIGYISTKKYRNIVKQNLNYAFGTEILSNKTSTMPLITV